MEALSDDEFDHVHDFDLSEPESEAGSTDSEDHGTPSTTPPRTQTPRPSLHKQIACPYDDCPKTFNRNAHLQEHLRSHTGERPFVCSYPSCSQAYMRETHLKHHVKSSHTNVRNYPCTWQGCDKAFATGTRLRRHLKAHETKDQYQCRGYEGCHATFRKHETLRKHILVEHEHKKPFPCDFVDPSTGVTCSHASESASKLESHKRAKHDSSKYSCSICASQKNGQDVLMTNDGHESFSFANFSELQAHIADQHPIRCPRCSMPCLSNKELKRHLELDHAILDEAKRDAKKFPCPYTECDHVSTKQGNLNVHVKTVHEKKKEFVCGDTSIPLPTELSTQGTFEPYGCGRSFTSKASLVEHVRTAHFFLPSKRAQREEKKQAKRAADGYLPGATPKRRMPRKDKGVKKTSTLHELIGNDSYAYPNAFGSVSATPMSNFGSYMDGDELNQLSGSVTMIGDHIYHNGKAHHLVSEDGSADQTTIDHGTYIPCPINEPAIKDEAHIEPFFDWEHEAELIHPNVDPRLLRV